MKRRLRRLTEAVPFSSTIIKSTADFLCLLAPFLKRLLSKTLAFLPFMDSLFFSDSDGLFGTRDRLSHPLSDLDDEQLYFVPYRWWNDAREALFGRGGCSGGVSGVLYMAKSSMKHTGLTDGWDGELDSEILLEMKRADGSLNTDCGEEGVSGSDFALVSEWMFLRALKWYNDVRDVASGLAIKNAKDLFPLQIRLSFLLETSALVVKIRQKDNEVGIFNKAYDIFCVESGLLRIWDFSEQTTQFYASDRKLSNDSGQSHEEILMEVQVYGLSSFMKDRRRRKDEIAIEKFEMEDFFSCGSLRMNGYNNVNLHYKVSLHPPFGRSYQEDCNVGLTGLNNLGNTCFMNSAIQCLVHTPKLVDYFLGDFRKDLNFENTLGMNGKLALAFGDLLRKLWAPGETAVTPRLFRSVLTGFAPQFSGYNQHDSQELLAFLLDGLHEDLNRVKCKPYVEVKDSEGRPNEEVADEHWHNHLSRNDSIIVDFCQGQYQSTLVCPLCKKLSITFDPFMYLSLPLPSTTMREMTITVFSTDGSTLPSSVTIMVPNYGRCKDLVQALSAACLLRDDEKLLVAEVYNNRILHVLDKPSDSVELIRDLDQLVAYRLPKDSDTYHLVMFMHQAEQLSYNYAIPKRLGVPLVAPMSDFSRGSEIRKTFLKLLYPFLMPAKDPLNNFSDADNTTNEDSQIEDVTSNAVLDGDSDSDGELKDNSFLDNDFQFYLDGGKNYHICMNDPVPITEFPGTINITVTWPEKMVYLYDINRLNMLPEVCNRTSFAKKSQESVSLYKCLEAFLKEEPLGPEDMWYCPTCKKHRQASKKLDLWRLPEILVIHLKRFSYNGYLSKKLETFVDFPIDNFDLSSYIVSRNGQFSSRYALYAVSNHHGGMGGGHYTAFVQHGHDRWYRFDDSSVYPAGEEEIKTSAAYVLFYRRI